VDFFKRKRKEYEHHLPPPPPPELVEKVQAVSDTAEIQLETAAARESDIEDRSAKSGKIKRDNALGPRFWQAVGEHRGT